MDTKQNIAFYNANFMITYFHEIMMSLCQIQIDKGNKVFVFACNRDLSVCDQNFDHNIVECKVCIRKQKLSRNLMDGAFDESDLLHPMIDLNDQEKQIVKSYKIPEHLTTSNVRELKFENLLVGYGIMSSFSNLTRDPNPDLSNFQVTIKRMIQNCIGTYLYFKRFILENNINTFYVLNGRYHLEKAVVEACKAIGINFFCFERGGDEGRVALFKNSTVHDAKGVAELVKERWQIADETYREQKVKEYIDHKLRVKKIKDVQFHDFTKNHIEGKLPEKFDSNKKNVVIFNSSDDEFRSLSPFYGKGVYEGQNEGVQKIFDSFKDRDNINLFLRVHPNLSNLENQFTKGISEINCYDNSQVIEATSDISTNALIQNCDLIIVFLSSTAIEATFQNKPVLVLQNSFYHYLDIGYRPKNHEQVIEYIENIPEPKPILDAKKFIYWTGDRGKKIKYFSVKNVLVSEFKNKNIHHLSSVGRIIRRGLQFAPIKGLYKKNDLKHAFIVHNKTFK